MKHILLTLIILVTPVLGEEHIWRTWTSTAETTLEAKLIKFDSSSVVLERRDGTQLSVKLIQLSALDNDFIEELAPLDQKGEPRIDGIEAKPGSISSRITCVDDNDWSYYVYLPKGFHNGRKWPVWFVMSPNGGQGGNELERYIAGADRLGCIIALSVESKNDFMDSELAMNAMVHDIFERFPVIKGLAFSSGFSGGSRMAYLMAEQDKRIAGVLACGSGSGVYPREGQFRKAQLRNSTYIYSLIGTNCFNRTGAYQSHKKFPDDFRLRFFSGVHEWAKSEYIAEGMARVLGDALINLKGNDFKRMRRSYAKTMWKWTQEMVERSPWEAHYWSVFLGKFPGDKQVQEQAEMLTHELESKPQVTLAIEAEKAIEVFSRKYFDVYYKEDQKPNKRRSAEAEHLSKKFFEIPHGDLIKRLGDKS